MKGYKLFILGAVTILVVASLFSLASAGFLDNLFGKDPSLAPRQVYPIPYPLRANSCDADERCEANQVLSPRGDFTNLFSSSLDVQGEESTSGFHVDENGNARVEGDLTYIGNLIGLDCAVINLDINQGGISTCANAGYSNCVTEEVKYSVTYFDSNNSTCGGRIQSKIEDYRIGTCTNGGGTGDAGCMRNTNGAEPYFGDSLSSTEQTPQGGKVLCCR